MRRSPAPIPSFEPSLWDPLLIALVGLICVIFILFSCCRMIKRQCAAFGFMNLSRNGDQSRNVDEAIENDDPPLQLQSRGLDSFIMHSLPITQFSKEIGEEWFKGKTECAVCLGEFEDGEWLKHLPRFSHVFLVSCIDTWFQNHSSCPLCRSYV